MTSNHDTGAHPSRNEPRRQQPPRRVRREIERRRRAETKRRAKAEEWGTGLTYAVALDGTDEEAIEEAKQQTHDSLIKMLGPRRRSGVSWLLFSRVEGLQKLAAIEAQIAAGKGERTHYTSDAVATLTALRTALAENATATLVIAQAQAVDA